MKVFNNILSITVLAVLVGCEHHDNSENPSLSSDTENVQAQLNSDADQVTNGMDSKAVSSSSESALIVTNQQQGGSQSDTESSGLVREWYQGSAGVQSYQGSGLEVINLSIGQEWTNSLPPWRTIPLTPTNDLYSDNVAPEGVSPTLQP